MFILSKTSLVECLNVCLKQLHVAPSNKQKNQLLSALFVQMTRNYPWTLCTFLVFFGSKLQDSGHTAEMSIPLLHFLMPIDHETKSFVQLLHTFLNIKLTENSIIWTSFYKSLTCRPNWFHSLLKISWNK